MRTRHLASLLGPAALGAAVLGTAGAPGDDWPCRLGPTSDGRSAATGVFAKSTAIVLKKAWSQRFDGGRAGIAVAGGRVITLAGDSEKDFAVAWDAASGRELWRVDLGATHPDQFLGPASTPLVDGARAFVLSSSCQLHALDAATGRSLWTLDVRTRFKATPRQGCQSSPTMSDGRLIVQTGSVAPDQPKVVALDPATGEPAWQATLAERAPYTNPLAATVGGVAQLLIHQVGAENAVGGITALDARTGAVLWSKTPAASKAMSYEAPLPLGADRVGLLTWNDFAVQQVKREGSAWTMEELWRSADLSAVVGPPVLFQGHLYGFGGEHLACVDAATGKVAWKERLYGGSVILVDGLLVVLSQASGEVRIVEPSPTSYREKAKLQVLSRGGRAEAPPSFAAGRIFVRNDEELAAISIEG
jgi:outer membrane protein assembly factor BamB